MTITEEPGSAASIGNTSKETSHSNDSRASLLKFQTQSIISELHVLRQLELRPVVIIIMGEVSETGAARPNPPRGRQGFIQAHVCRMRRIAQGVKNCDVHALASLNRV